MKGESKREGRRVSERVRDKTRSLLSLCPRYAQLYIMPRSRTSYLALPDADAVLNAVPAKAKAKAKAKAMLPRSG